MHTGTKRSKEIERRLSERETKEPTIKSADVNQQVEVRLSRKVRQPVKTLLPFDDKSFRPIGQSNYAGRVGEAETGSGGDQPDRGIAGRNSSRTMRGAWSSRRVLLPGLGADRREAARSRPRVWFCFCFGPHRTDRFRHA